jgi:hypothetical protein
MINGGMMDRNNWAATTADAALNDFDMGVAVIIYETTRQNFSWQNSMSPVRDGDILVDSDVHWEHFTYESEIKPTRDELIEFFMSHACDHFWREIQNIISEELASSLREGAN